MGRRSGPRYYAVANGRNNGIYDSWDDCSQQVTGYGGATFKSFSTQAEAEAFIDSHRPQSSSDDNRYDNNDSEPEETYYAPPSRARRTHSPPRDDRPRYDAYPRTVAPAAVPYAYSAPDVTPTYSREPVREPEGEPVRHHHRHSVQEVYVDGACSSNGQRGALAGYGGYYGDSDGRNFSLPVPDTEPQTNNRGELRAVIHVMDRELSSGTPLQPLRIHTDSKYVLDGLTKYSKKWVSNGFRLSTNDPVKNQDLWQKAIDLRNEYNTRYSQQERKDKRYTAHNTMNDPSEAVELRHVRGHSKIHGNERADELAVLGAKRHRPH